MAKPLEPQEGVVLVVDDDASTRILVAGWLRGSGLEALEVSSGEEALATVRANPNAIDAVILDVTMPGMDGFQVLSQLKADSRSSLIPIVFLSAAARESDVVRGVRAGAIDYLSKPFSGPILVTKIKAVLERARAERALHDKLRSAEESATTDGLTGLSNRRAFDQRLSEMVANAVRHNEPLSLMMLDIDHFKAINDELGHIVGDLALVHLAGKLRGVVRAGDQAFRYGGEEFLLLLAKCDRVGAVRVFHRLREGLRAVPFTLEGGTARPISVSGGVASAEADNGFLLGNLVGRADDALYAAKRGGRDRMEIEKNAKG
jgi:two-component system cell cycle response regulator